MYIKKCTFYKKSGKCDKNDTLESIKIEWMVFIMSDKLIKSKKKIKFVMSWKNKILFGRW